MSRTLVLLRHAEAVDPGPNEDDFGRTLTSLGRDHALMAGTALARAGIRPDAIVSSPAPRALQTAELAGAELGCSPAQIQREPRVYEAAREDLLAVVRRVRQADCLMLVGHNPGLSEFGQWLARLPRDWHLEKAGAACFQTTQAWAALAPESARLLRALPPA